MTINNDVFTPKELTKEKSLWDIYVSSRRIKTSCFNAGMTTIIFVILVLNSLLTAQPVNEMLDIVREFAYTSLTVALSILGFLVAGFTIFATISQPSLSLSMAEIPHPDSGLSWLKHNYFIFLRVFIYYLSFTVFCLLIEILGHKGGFLSLLLSYSPYSECLKVCIVKASYVLLFTGFFFLIMQLKSFIFNIYHSVMTALRWRAEGCD